MKDKYITIMCITGLTMYAVFSGTEGVKDLLLLTIGGLIGHLNTEPVVTAETPTVILKETSVEAL